MEYLFIALAVFWLIRLIKTWVEAPSWFWQISTLIFAGLAVLPWADERMDWFAPFAIAGIVTFLQLIENVLIAKADELLTNIMRRR